MAYPPGITACTCTFGSDFTALGETVSLSATVGVVSPGNKRIVWTATGQSLFVAIPSGAIKADSGEALSFQVPHVDQPGFTDGGGNAYTMWGYKLVWRATGPGGQTDGTIFFGPVQGQSTLDLDNVPDGTVAVGVSVPNHYATIDDASGDVIDGNGQPVSGLAATGVSAVVSLTQAEYDALTPDATTLYVVTS